MCYLEYAELYNRLKEMGAPDMALEERILPRISETIERVLKHLSFTTSVFIFILDT